MVISKKILFKTVPRRHQYGVWKSFVDLFGDLSLPIIIDLHSYLLCCNIRLEKPPRSRGGGGAYRRFLYSFLDLSLGTFLGVSSLQSAKAWASAVACEARQCPPPPLCHDAAPRPKGRLGSLFYLVCILSEACGGAGFDVDFETHTNGTNS